jgi:uncharacterized protein (TIRG00374 family)
MALLSRFARLAVAAGLTAYILWKSHPGDVLAVVANADWRPLLLAVALVVLDRALMAYRWVELLCTINPGERPALATILRIFFVSTFVGTFLPASVGGDAVRAYSLSRWNVRAGDAIASVFMDRMLGVTSILLMALVGLILARDLVANVTIVTALGVAALASVMTLVLIFSARAESALSRILDLMPATVRDPGNRLLESMRRYATHRRSLLGVLAGSVTVQVLRILQAYLLGRSLNIAAPIEAYFAFVPLILLVMLLPVTFNGIGTSQFAFVWFFARAGVASSPAFALSVLFVALGIVGNLPGGLLYAFGWGRAPTGAAPSAGPV